MNHFIKVAKNVTLHAQDLGEGKPIVCLHGWPLNEKMFEYQMNQIPKWGHRFIGIDLRGYGKSDAPYSGYDYNTMAEDIKKIIDSLKLKNILLVGFSMGGAIAIRYMSLFKQHRVEKLLLVAAAAPTFIKTTSNPSGHTTQEIEDLRKLGLINRPYMLSEFSKMFFHRKMDAAFKAWFDHLCLENSSFATIFSLDALRDENVTNDFSKITVPTAIFHGKNDKVCPYPFAEIMHKSIENSSIVPFADCGHGLMFEEVEKFNKELIKFIRK